MKMSFKKYGKYFVGIAALSALVSQLVFPAASMQATEPRFNFLQNDYELLRGANVSNNETVWKDPVSGQAGDTFEGLIYYHNGIPDAPAKNTRIQVSIPSQTVDKTATLSATISADNAATVSNTIVDDQIIGFTGLTVNLDKDADLTLVPGSVKWYPDRSEKTGPDSPLPFGQSGNEIISQSGLNIGDIQGCWQYAGFVVFAFKTTPRAEPANLTLTKTVRNVSDNQSEYVKQVSADQSEKVSFKIDVANNGGSNLETVYLSDQMPGDLSAVNGSAWLNRSGNLTSLDLETLLASGVSIGSLAKGEAVSVTFEATAPSQISVAKFVVNNARAWSGNLVATDTAQVNLVPGQANIVKSKSAYNATQKIDATTHAARAGDTIEYTLVTKNTGNLNTNVQIEDGIADILEYADIISISDSGATVPGPANTNEAVIVQYPTVNIASGAEVTQKFTVKVKNPLPTNSANGFHFDDKIYNKYGNEIVICIERPAPFIPEPDLRIDKLVRDVTKNELTYVKADEAFAGDILEYKISFKNVGTGPADYVKVFDVLPANVVLDPNAPAIINLGDGEKTITERITDGYTIKTLAPGQEGYVRFRALTSASLAANESLKNVGFLEDNGATINSEATTVIAQKVVEASVPVKNLPKTGAASGLISAMIAIFGTANIAYLKQRKLLRVLSRQSKVI